MKTKANEGGGGNQPEKDIQVKMRKENYVQNCKKLKARFEEQWTEIIKLYSERKSGREKEVTPQSNHTASSKRLIGLSIFAQ